MSLFPCQFCRCTFFCSSYSWEVFNFFPFDLFNDSGNFWRKIPWIFFRIPHKVVSSKHRLVTHQIRALIEHYVKCTLSGINYAEKCSLFLNFPAGSLGKQLEANQLAMDNIRQKYLLGPCIICMEAIKSCCVFSSMQKICTHSLCKARQHTHTNMKQTHRDNKICVNYTIGASSTHN